MVYKSGGSYSRRAVEVDIIRYVDDVLADPDTSLSLALIIGSRLHGLRALLVQGVVARLRERGCPDSQPVQIRGQWSETGAIQFCVSEADVPAGPPPADSPVRILLTVCFDLDSLPRWTSSADAPHTRTLPIGPLSLFEAQDFIEARLGGPVAPYTARTLGSLGGFVPHALSVIVDECRNHAVLDRIDGTWMLRDDPIRGAIVPYLRAQLAAAGPAVARSLFRFALTEPFSIDELAPDDSQVATMLLTDGELHRRDDGRVEYTVAASGLGLRELAPDEDRQRLYCAALSSRAPTVDAIRWAAAAGHPVSPEVLSPVLRSALESSDWQVVVDLVSDALSREGAPGEDVPRCRLGLHSAFALRLLGESELAHARLADVDEMLSSITDSADSAEVDELRTTAHLILADLLHFAGADPDAALGVLAPGAHDPGQPRLTAHTFLHQVYCGRHGEAQSTLESASHWQQELPSDTRDRVTAARMLLLTAGGKPNEALRESGRAARRGGGHQGRPLWVEEELRTAYATAALGCNGPDVFPILERYLAEPGSPHYRPDLVSTYFTKAVWDHARGDVASAHRYGCLALDAAESHDPDGLAPAVAALVAETSALLGEHAGAVALLDGFAEAAPRSSAVHAGRVRGHRAVAQLVLKQSGSGEALGRDAGVFSDQGQFGFAAETLYAGVRFGRRRAARSLCAIAGHLDGELHRMRTSQAEALLAEDPVALLDVSAELQEVGLRLFAAEAAAMAAAMRSAPDSLRRRATTRVATFLSEQSLAGHPLLSTVTTPGEAPLTRREREVATLIDSGLSNVEIASRLSLSLSTVEGHITRIYRKTGGRRRAPARR